MTPDQLSLYGVPSDPRLHPDGRRVAFVVTRMDLAEDRYERRIWLDKGGEARPLTAGPGDSSPRWSPDGTRLAFLRSGDQAGVSQIAILPLAGGEATTITSFSRGVAELEWSPDGANLAVTAREWTEDLGPLDERERLRRPRRITQFPYRRDDQGWVYERTQHVYLVDPDGTNEPRCLTPGDFEEAHIAWRPDGAELAFVSARHETRGLDPGTRVWTVPAAGGDAVARTDVGFWERPSYDRDGNLYAIGTTDVWSHPAPQPLQRIEEDGNLTDLTGHLDRSLLTSSPAISPATPQWLDDGSALSTLEDGGRVHVVRLSPDGVCDPLVGGDLVVTGVAPRRDGSAFAFVATSPTDPGELWWWADGVVSTLTDLNGAFGPAASLVEPSRFTIDHEGVSVDGWIYLPPGEEPVPTLLNIHGGPATQYGYQFFDEFQVYAAAGYGVIAINPRGSSGYGRDHATAVVGTWFENQPPDLRDLLAAADAACAAEPRLDSDRIGIMGGSYGGFASVRVVSADRRYRSCIAERGLYTWHSFVGTSDIGPWFDRIYLGDATDVDAMSRAGTLARIDDVATPTLVLHSDGDWRCPVEQAEQLFVALLARGVETEFVRFPADEGHELSRNGSPRHRRERFEIILEWHARHLLTG